MKIKVTVEMYQDDPQYDEVLSFLETHKGNYTETSKEPKKEDVVMPEEKPEPIQDDIKEEPEKELEIACKFCGKKVDDNRASKTKETHPDFKCLHCYSAAWINNTGGLNWAKGRK